MRLIVLRPTPSCTTPPPGIPYKPGMKFLCKVDEHMVDLAEGDLLVPISSQTMALYGFPTAASVFSSTFENGKTMPMMDDAQASFASMAKAHRSETAVIHAVLVGDHRLCYAAMAENTVFHFLSDREKPGSAVLPLGEDDLEKMIASSQADLVDSLFRSAPCGLRLIFPTGAPFFPMDMLPASSVLDSTSCFLKSRTAHAARFLQIPPAILSKFGLKERVMTEKSLDEQLRRVEVLLDALGPDANSMVELYWEGGYVMQPFCATLGPEGAIFALFPLPDHDAFPLRAGSTEEVTAAAERCAEALARLDAYEIADKPVPKRFKRPEPVELAMSW